MTLQEIGYKILKQNNRMTKDPIFVVQEKKRILGLDPDYANDHAPYVWIDVESGDYEEADEDTSIDLDDKSENDEDCSPWAKFYYMDAWEFVTACFTEQGSKDFIARERHNHGELRIYAFSSYRNKEWNEVRNHLISQAFVTDSESA